MSTLKLKTPEDIVTFLKLLAEESVKDARESIKADPGQKFFTNQMKKDRKLFTGGMTEQDEAEEVIADVEEDVEESPSDAPTIEASLSSVTDAVKDLRSGHGVDDQLINDELRIYFDRLSGTEQVTLLTFMRAFAGILTMSMKGSEAPDPSDPPTNISISGAEKPEPEEEVEVEEEVEEEAPSPEGEEEEEEDTSPPIKAGSPANLAEIRKRVRKLMK